MLTLIAVLAIASVAIGIARRNINRAARRERACWNRRRGGR